MRDFLLQPEALCQVGFVVHDAEATAAKYAELLGVPVPEIIETPGYARAKTTVQGQPSEATAKLAFFRNGQLVLELIQPDDKPSVWREHLDRHGEGVHHIAFGVPDTRAAEQGFAQYGIKTVQQGLYADASGMYSYLDSTAHLGVMIELLESFKK